MEIEPIPPRPSSNIRHRRSMTAAAYNYTRQQFWHVISGLIIFLDPYVRPFVRTFVTEILRWFLSRIPVIISAVVFDVHNLNVRYIGKPDVELSVAKIELLTSLQFVRVRRRYVSDTRGHGTRAAKRLYSMAAWKSRLSGSIRRSWSNVVAEQEAKAKISLKLDDIVGSLPSAASIGRCKFLRLPGSISVDTSMAFDLKRRSLKTHSMNTNVSIGACYVELGPILAAMKSMDDNHDVHDIPEVDVADGMPTSSDGLSFLYIPSPTPSTFSLQSPRSPQSVASLSPLTPRSPRSPFLESISASILPRRHRYNPSMKLRDTQTKAMIAFLDSLQIHFSSISFISQPESDSQTNDSFTTSVENIVIKAEISDPQKNRLHSQWFGRNVHNEAFDSDVYSLSLSVDRLRVHRQSNEGRLRLLALNSVSWQLLTTQWPSPLLVTSPFLGGDPNAPTVVVRMTFGAVYITEDASAVSSYARRFERKQPKEAPLPSPSPSPASPPLPIPRVVLELECGPISGTLLIPQESRRIYRALEMKIDGVMASSHAQFINRFDQSGPATDQFDELPLTMLNSASLSLKSMFLRTRSDVTGYVSSDCVDNISYSPAEDQPLLSLETLEITCNNSALAVIKDDTQNTACVDLSTMDTNLSCFTDTVCVELWHPFVRDVLEQLITLIPVRPPQPSKVHGPKRPLSGSFTISFQKIILFVTAPDINPNDQMELSRGFSTSVTGLSAQWDAPGSRELTQLGKIRQNLYWENRSKLGLSEDLRARSTAVASSTISGIARLTLPRIVVRSAIATQYAPDDPLMGEEEDPALGKQRFLQIEGITFDYSQRNRVEDVKLHISYVQGMFSLTHVYSLMLASQTFKRFGDARVKPAGLAVPKDRRSFNANVIIGTVQVQCNLRKERVVCRFDRICVDSGMNKPLELSWERTFVWARIPAAVNRWDDGKGFKWKEIMAMQKWNVSLPLPLTGREISVNGDTVRIHIPFGFVLANLILDVSVTVKACKHLYNTTKCGRYFPVPEPEAEGPKSVPRITVRVAFLCFQAADDNLESKLSLIFRSGPKAAQCRAEREKAFMAKIHSIMASDGFPVASDDDAPWQFSSMHSVPVQEARSRLDRVHMLDWIMRLEHTKSEQTQMEEGVMKRFRGLYAKTNRIPNLVKVSAISDASPIFRASLSNLSLSIDKPSFSLDSLPDFLAQQGGLPKETAYSLLVPLHIRFSLSSLKATLRDYPLALAHISSPSEAPVTALEFETDLVIAEEMGPPSSVEWIDCSISNWDGRDSGSSLHLSIPKTIMPVKSYANPEIRVVTSETSSFSWGISYAAATHDLMRVVESLTSAPKDPSPPVGFWDKVQLPENYNLQLKLNLYFRCV
ncbi:Protein SABRE [Paramarasmius palmivorus]|uniref:Protein SABRE n=1 Tax=Paramarasmius palmivorus TaxID=297713 RepID=A0AAW0E884_9AGAR